MRKTVGEYGLCRRCARRLDSEISAWARKLDADLCLLERFDAYAHARALDSSKPTNRN